MNTLVLNKKELLLMKHLNKWNNMSLEEKKCKFKEAETADKEDKQRASIQSATEELERCFCNSFEREGVRNATINLSLKRTRDDILQHIPESRIEYDYLNKNYEKILNRVKKIYKNDMKAQEQIQQLIFEKQLEEQQIQQEEMKKSPTYKILLGLGVTGLVLFVLMKWALLLGIGVCVIIFLVILGCSKK